MRERIPDAMRGQLSKSPILSTKLNRPAAGDGWVQRPRLISRLDQGRKRRVALISAPAGFGKTTLAVQWLDRIRGPSAWLSLDKRDNDPERLLRYLVAAFRRAVPAACSGVESLLSAVELPPPDYLTEALVSDLAEIRDPVVLVLDDYHAAGSGPVQNIVSGMLQHLPDNLHIVVLTRVDPPWPLGLWRVRGWLDELRADDLRFSREEAQSFFSLNRENPIPAETIDMLQSRTEGWIAGLELVRLSLGDVESPQEFARNFSDSDRLMVDFLMDEVVRHQPPEILDFLAITSILERFSAPLCDFLLADDRSPPDTRRIIARLETENLFLVPLDSERLWYRYHHLFQYLLIHNLKQNLSPERKARLHRRAGEWFAGQGQVEEAVRHFLLAGDEDAAATLFEKHLHAVIDGDLSRRVLGRWLDMFPKSAEKRPVLLVAETYRKIFHWDLPGIGRLLDQAEASIQKPAAPLTEESRRSLQGDIDLQRSFYLYWQGDAEGALRHARQAISFIPKEHGYAHTLAVMYSSLSHALCGRRDEALRLLAEALTDDCAAGSRNAGVLLVTRAGIHCYAADLSAVEETAKRILALHETVPVPEYWLGYAHYFLGITAYERNLLDTAADRFGRVERMRYRVITRLYQEVLLGLSLVAFAKGEEGKAREYGSSARSFAVEVRDPYSMQISDSFKTRLAILSGDFRDGPAGPPLSGVDSNKIWLEVPSLTRAEYLIRKATPSDCAVGLQCIENGIQRAEHHHNTRQKIQFLAVKAMALKCAGRPDDALEVLEGTLQMAKPHEFVRTFVDRGPMMAGLLNVLSERSPEKSYIHTLLDAFRAERSAVARAAPSSREYRVQTDSPLLGGLSDRELDVLAMLEERLSNKEIAERLFISPETVKKHTFNMYRKLNVQGRRQAVSTAKKLGLLQAE